MTNIIQLTDINKVYTSGKLVTPALINVTLTIHKGEMVAIMGPSGSGKSTLMNIIGLLDRPTGGKLLIDDNEINLSMSDSKLAKLRGRKIGFVFQSFNLLPRLTALGNVLLPTGYQKVGRTNAKERANKLLEQVGLGERISHRPNELSGGEKQRVAIARALINDPEIILADEPTGNLDSKSGNDIIALLRALNKEGKTIIIISHDSDIAHQCDRTIRIRDGQLEIKKVL